MYFCFIGLISSTGRFSTPSLFRFTFFHPVVDIMNTLNSVIILLTVICYFGVEK